MAAPTAPTLSAPPLGAAANAALAASAKAAAKAKLADKAKGAAQDFEAVFLNTMFQQMFSEHRQRSVRRRPGGRRLAVAAHRRIRQIASPRPAASASPTTCSAP